MDIAIELSEQGKKKLQIYFAAKYLFDKGKSHPQIIEILREFEPDITLLESIVDKAMFDAWDKLFDKANSLFASGMNYEQTLAKITEKEPDTEIATWICRYWYRMKEIYAECFVDGATNRFEGMKAILISGLGVIVMFVANSSWIIKGIWILALLLSSLQWLVGMQQRDMAKRLDKLFTQDFEVKTSK